MSVLIRTAIPEDVYAIRAVQKAGWLATYPNESYGISLHDIESVFADDDTESGRQRLEDRKQRINKEDTQTFVAIVEQKLVGFIVVQKNDQESEVLATYVHPDSQRLGIGKQLMSRGLEWLSETQAVIVHVVAYNAGAIDFYERMGFVMTDKIIPPDSAAILPTGKLMPEVEMVKSSQ